MNERARLGRAGEDAAADHLRAHGYRIVKRNLRGPGGEIDIVAWDGPTLAFVEVKTRASSRFGSAISAVDRAKGTVFARSLQIFSNSSRPARKRDSTF